MTNVIYLDAGAIIDLEKTGYGHLPTDGVIYKIPDVVYEFEIGKETDTSAFKAFEQWRTSNSNGAVVEFAVTVGRIDFSDPDVARQYGVTWQNNGKPKQIGDAAVKFLENADGIFSLQGASVITNDRGLMDFATQNSSGRGAYTTTMDFFNELLADNSISLIEYKAIASSLEGRIRSQYPSEYKEIVADSSVLSHLEVSNTPDGPVISYLGIEITPGLLTKVAIGAEVLKNAGLVGDVFEVSLAINKANSLLEADDPVGAEAVYAELAGNLLGGAAGTAGAVVAAGALIAGTGVGLLPGAFILVAAGVAGGVGGAAVGQALSTSLHTYAVNTLNNGKPLILDDLVSIFHNELKAEGIYTEVIVTQALMNVDWTSNDLDGELYRAYLEAVENDPSLLNDPEAFQSAVNNAQLMARGNIIGGPSNGEIAEVYRLVLAARNKECFGSGTLIDMWPLDLSLKPGAEGIYDQNAVSAKIWHKSIELVEVGDLVVAFDDEGHLVPGPVTQTFRNNVKVLLNFHGTRVTPGHVYYRPDSHRAQKFETLIDVLRDDGVIQRQDGTLVRAATDVPVGDPLDGFVQAITGEVNNDGSLTPKERGRIRLGTRFVDGHKVFCIADLIAAGGGKIGEDELIHVDGGAPMPFHWHLGDTLPKPEDFVLTCSGTTLEDIYKASEWEGQHPRMPAPLIMDGGPVQRLSQADLSVMPRNTPPDLDVEMLSGGVDRAQAQNPHGGSSTKTRSRSQSGSSERLH